MENKTKAEIEEVIEEAYLRGVHGDQDPERVKNGFHPEFAMLVLKDNQLEKVDVDGWLARVEGMKSTNPQMWQSKTSCRFEIVDVTGYAAVAKLDVWKGKVPFSTDYMLLYRFAEGWRVVSKIYSIPT
jgi:hypothetical protein